MKLITRDTDYAIRALLAAASEPGKMTNVDELVKKTKIPKPFLRKIVQTLNKHKLIKSFKGRGGGFLLSVDPADLTIIDIIEVFQGEFRLTECFFRKKACPRKEICKLKKSTDDIADYVKSKLREISLASLAEK